MKEENTLVFPPFFFNSIPKSGTHLLKQILLVLPNIKHDELKGLYGHVKYNPQCIEWLSNIQDNEFMNGHIFYSSEWEDLLFGQFNLKQLFVIRDPRDILVSMAYFIPKLTIHDLYNTFTAPGIEHKDRMLMLIEGVESKNHPSINKWFENFLGWMEKEFVLTVRFEELMTDETSLKSCVRKIINFIVEDLITDKQLEEFVEKMVNNIDQTTSPTFRKGKIGGWRDSFDDEVKYRFKSVAGDLLISLGYEKDDIW